MKQKGLIIAASALFLIVNTMYFWEAKLGMLGFPFFFLLIVWLFVLLIVLCWQIILAIIEGFKEKSRNLTIGFTAVILTLIFFKPGGVIDFDRFAGNDLLVAKGEGAANCMTTLKLKENNVLRERTICFGVTELKGTYEIKNDTIFFKNVELGRDGEDYYEFAIVRKPYFYKNNPSFYLVNFRNLYDTTGAEMLIIKNELSLK